jgi:hypothetical protein
MKVLFVWKCGPRSALGWPQPGVYQSLSTVAENPHRTNLHHNSQGMVENHSENVALDHLLRDKTNM